METPASAREHIMLFLIFISIIKQKFLAMPMNMLSLEDSFLSFLRQT